MRAVSTGFFALAVLLLGASAEGAKPWRRFMAQKDKEQKKSVQAPPAANCTFTEILATNGDKKDLDPKLKKLEAKLAKPPFNGWNTFKLLGEPAVKAEKDKPASVTLATKGKLTLLLKDKMEARGGKSRLRLGIDIDNKDGKRTLSTVMVFGTGEWHFPVAGVPFDKGVYILAINCTRL
jgi:hypothetical protein